jgi:hypothetical protein
MKGAMESEYERDFPTRARCHFKFNLKPFK